MKQIIVIGGGPAGMAAAIAAAENECRVILLEKNEKLGKKLFITGKGRCNVTNAGDMEDLFAHVATNRKFLYSAFYGYDNFMVMNFFEQQKVPLKTERGNRVFPVSDHSSDILGALQRALADKKVEVRLHTRAKAILVRKGKAAGVEIAGSGEEKADAVILATGGVSYPSTGATGDGYRFAEETGHRVEEPVPSLVPFRAKEEYVKSLQGLSLKNVAITVRNGKKILFEDFGEMLFTHFGVSGPLVLSASSIVGRTLKKQELLMEIDLKPALIREQLDARLLRDFEENKNKRFKNSISGLLPAKMLPVVICLSGIESEKKVNEVTKEERKNLIRLLKAFPVTLTGLMGFQEAIITKGGVSVSDVNPSTMESKKLPGLYFAGEVLDLDAQTGGYNLQIAWSTGHLAGLCAAKREESKSEVQ